MTVAATVLHWFKMIRKKETKKKKCSSVFLVLCHTGVAAGLLRMKVMVMVVMVERGRIELKEMRANLVARVQNFSRLER